MEPHYVCSLCGSQGQSNCIVSHLTGKTHRQNFAISIYGEEALLDVTQAKLAQIARDHDEKKSGFEKRIKTVFSDVEYPWPSGMAPWLIENGGTGIVPQSQSQLPERKKPGRAEWRQIKPR